MSASVSTVYLMERATDRLVKAKLYEAISDKHLGDFERLWRPITIQSDEEHGHWNWRQKIDIYSESLSHESFAIECEGKTQGLMIVNTTNRCRIKTQRNLHLVYIEYLEAAPWNRPSMSGGAKYKGVGTIMIAAAIQLSIEEGNGGCIGLHSLPQADAFYRNTCGMTDLGPDRDYSPSYSLRYFEMTKAQALKFIEERK